MPTQLSYVCKINTKISSKFIILNIFKANYVGKTLLLSYKNKIAENFRMSHDQFPLKYRSTFASSVSVNIHLAHTGDAQNESVRLSQQGDTKISNFKVCATYAPSGNCPLRQEFSIVILEIQSTQILCIGFTFVNESIIDSRGEYPLAKPYHDILQYVDSILRYILNMYWIASKVIEMVIH